MKTFKQGLFFIVFFLSAFTGYSQKQSLEWIPFQWESATISDKYIEQAFLYVPVKIEDLPQDFTMQLDLGAFETQFYGNTIKPYLEEFSALAAKLDTIHFNGRVFPDAIFRGVKLHMGPVTLPFDVWHRYQFGEEIPRDSLYTETQKHIGTIAADLFQDRILIIDYASNRFAVTDALPIEYEGLSSESFEVKNGIIMLPFRIDGKEQKLMFDTGSSPFPLASSKERALEISNGAIIDSLSGPLWWGEEITFYGMEINKPIEFGEKTLQNGLVYYDKEGLWEENVFKPGNIWGLTGNAYFFDNTVIIDYKNKLFRIK